MSSKVEIRTVPDRVVVGPHGHCISSGYTEIGGVRFYPERLVIGPRGPMILPARIEVHHEQ